MRLTREHLKRIIREEIENLREEAEVQCPHCNRRQASEAKAEMTCVSCGKKFSNS